MPDFPLVGPQRIAPVRGKLCYDSRFRDVSHSADGPHVPIFLT